VCGVHLSTDVKELLVRLFVQGRRISLLIRVWEKASCHQRWVKLCPCVIHSHLTITRYNSIIVYIACCLVLRAEKEREIPSSSDSAEESQPANEARRRKRGEHKFYSSFGLKGIINSSPFSSPAKMYLLSFDNPIDRTIELNSKIFNIRRLYSSIIVTYHISEILI
jgi:hypothetical protein